MSYASNYLDYLNGMDDEIHPKYMTSNNNTGNLISIPHYAEFDRYTLSVIYYILFQKFPVYKLNSKLAKKNIIEHILNKEEFDLVSFSEIKSNIEEENDEGEKISEKEKLSTISAIVISKKYPDVLIKISNSAQYSQRDRFDVEISSITESYKEIERSFEKFRYSKQTNPRFGILAQSGGGHLNIHSMPFEKDVSVDVELNYGMDFVKKHHEIVNKLKEVSGGGLYLFNGEPGTGKTTYIKYLTSQVPNRLFVFIPTSFVSVLADPSLISVLITNQNCVLVIEDAEKALVSRESHMESSAHVSNILNLTDGILGSLLNVSIIATYNTKSLQLDTALTRKGRLRINHCFDRLSKEDSQRLIDHLKKPYKTTSPMTLTEIYNLEENNYAPKSKHSVGVI